jgi:hypothetical protein
VRRDIRRATPKSTSPTTKGGTPMNGGIERPVSAREPAVTAAGGTVSASGDEPASALSGGAVPGEEAETPEDAVATEFAPALPGAGELPVGVVVAGPVDFGVVGAAVVGVEPGLASKVPVRCHCPVKLLKGPPTI